MPALVENLLFGDQGRETHGHIVQQQLSQCFFGAGHALSMQLENCRQPTQDKTNFKNRVIFRNGSSNADVHRWVVGFTIFFVIIRRRGDSIEGGASCKALVDIQIEVSFGLGGWLLKIRYAIAVDGTATTWLATKWRWKRRCGEDKRQLSSPLGPSVYHACPTKFHTS